MFNVVGKGCYCMKRFFEGGCAAPSSWIYNLIYWTGFWVILDLFKLPQPDYPLPYVAFGLKENLLFIRTNYHVFSQWTSKCMKYVSPVILIILWKLTITVITIIINYLSTIIFSISFTFWFWRFFQAGCWIDTWIPNSAAAPEMGCWNKAIPVKPGPKWRRDSTWWTSRTSNTRNWHQVQ